MHNPHLTISADGRVTLPSIGDVFSLRDMDDPLQFFSDLRAEYTANGQAPDSAFYAYISADTTANCNLRCKFCFDDFANASSARMTTEDFQKLIALAPLTFDGYMFLSCLYEPFLNASFLNLLELVPEIGRRKCFFTTNLCVKRFKPEMFERLAGVNLAYFNISLDSFDRSTFEHLRVNADYDVFRANLELMTEVLQQYPAHPPIRFISVAVRSNADQIRDLICMTSERFGAAQHEVRMPFVLPHAPADWRERESLTSDEWAVIEDQIASLPYPTKVMPDGGTARYYGDQSILAGLA